MSRVTPRLVMIWSLFLWGLLILNLIRLEYVLWNYSQLRNPGWGDLAMAWGAGLRFDLAASAWLIAPLLLLSFVPWPRSWGKLVGSLFLVSFLVLHLPFWFINLVDVEFVNFVGRRMTADVLFLLTEAQGKTGGFFNAYPLLMFVGATVLMIGSLGAWWVGTRVLAWGNSQTFTWKSAATGIFLSLLLAVVLTRGGFQEKPIHFVNAQIFSEPAMNLVVLNSTFTVLKSFSQPALPENRFFEDPLEVRSLLNGAVPGPSLLEGRRPQRPQNIVILILESFGLEYMGDPIGVKGYTPFLDQLAQRSLFFKNGFANGRRSIEGIPAVLSSVPALMNEPFVTSNFSNGKFPGLGALLERRGYHTSFFHGGNNGTMHFDAYTEAAGFSNYFGSHEYPDRKDHDGVWGIYDGPMLRWFKDKLGQFPKPFVATFFSISSHNPYLIPPELRDRYPEGPLPILKTILYTDDSLKEFFAAAEKEEWYQDTLFVVTADHTYQAYLPEFDHEFGRFQVPILFFHPNYTWPDEVDRNQLVQQIDILPSILDFLGVEVPEPNLLARSVFVPGEKTVSLFVDGKATLVAEDHFLTWSASQDPKLYSREDPAATSEVDVPELRQKLEKRLKASLQYFSESMRGNAWGELTSVDEVVNDGGRNDHSAGSTHNPGDGSANQTK